MGQLVVWNTKDDTYTKYGTGPLLAFIKNTPVSAGNNRKADHYMVMQSWCGAPCVNTPMEIDPPDIPEGPTTTNASMTKRLNMTGASTSDADFDARFGNTKTIDDFLCHLDPEPPRTRVTILSQIAEATTYIEQQHKTWPDELKHLAVGALILYRVRLSDIYVREYALLFHMILGDRFVR